MEAYKLEIMAMIELKEFNEMTRDKLQTFCGWAGQQYATVIAGKGFSYTGTDEVIKCDECKATVNMASGSVGALTNEHNPECKIRKYLHSTKSSSEDSHESSHRGSSPRVLSSSSPNIQWQYKEFLDDLIQYNTIDSIIRAPSVCPCTECKYDLSYIRNGRRDFYNGTRRFLLTFGQEFGQDQGPVHSEFETVHSRLRTFELETESTDGNISTQAEAGFYYTGQGGNRECFFCGLNLRAEMVVKNPWREHARWCPFCPFVAKQKQPEFVHRVIQETKMLKSYLKGLNRPKNMKTEIVIEAMNEYTRCSVGDAIEILFWKYGSFPTRDELFHELESVKLWKTAENYDYCYE